MSTPPKRRSAKRGRVKGDYAQGPYYSQNAPTEVYPGSEYRPDPALHSTDTKPPLEEQPKPVAEPAPEPEGKERNAVLTAPLPLVVSAPEAIDKMEALNELIEEGRPDLAQETAAVAQALDSLERKALGDAAFSQHEGSEGHDPATGAAPGQAPAFMPGDRVVMALDDGEYTGEIQKDNGDGTFDVKTDQMATFRRVPAQSIARPEMLQPVASKEPKKMKKPPVKKAKAQGAEPAKRAGKTQHISEVLEDAAKGKGKVADAIREGIGKAEKKLGAKLTAAKFKADFMEKQVVGPVDGVEVQMKDGESFVMPLDGDAGVEAVAKAVGAKPEDIGGVDKIHGFFGRYSAPGYLDATEWVFDQDKDALEKELERIFGLGDEFEASRKVMAMKEGYNLVDGVKVVEENGQPRAFDQDKDETVPAELYVNAEGKLALLGPDGEANYEDAANDEVELAYWKAVHGLIPEAPKAEKPAEDGEAKAQENVKKWAEKAGVAAKKVAAGIKRLPSGRWKDTNGNSYETAEEAAEAEATSRVEALDPKADPESEEFISRVQVEKEHILDSVKAAKKDKKGDSPKMCDSCGKHVAQKGKEYCEACQLDSGVEAAAKELMDEHKVKAEKFHAVLRASGKVVVSEWTAAAVREALKGGLKKADVLGLFDDPEAAGRFAKIAGGDRTAQDELHQAAEELENAESAVAMAELELGEAPDMARDAARAGAESARHAADHFDRAAANVEGSVVASGTKAELAKDPTFAMVLGGFKAADADLVEIMAAADGIVTARLKAAPEAPAPQAPTVEASAFDEIPELEIGGGMTARRKKGGEGKDEGKKVEVVDKDGKVVATYPDAFGDDTVAIIQFLRQVLDIKEADDKKAAKGDDKGEKKGGDKGAKKGDGESAEDKPVVLPDAKPEKDSGAKEGKAAEEEKEKLKASAKWLEDRIEVCRQVVEAMVRKGHVVASQEDVDAELLKGKTLREAQVVAARKAIDGEVMRLLSKPEAELQVIKASLPLLKDRQVKVQASEGHLDLVNISAAGLIHESSGKRASIGMALAASFHR